MGFVETLTPKHTEEVKPGLFIQKYARGYRQIYPAAWEGKINWYNFIFGGKIRNLIWFFIILMVVFGFYMQTGDYIKFYDSFMQDPIEFCKNVTMLYDSPGQQLDWALGLERLNESSYIISGDP